MCPTASFSYDSSKFFLYVQIHLICNLVISEQFCAQLGVYKIV